MKKRMLCLITALALLLALPLSARADVIYTPPDAFYEAHREECDYVNRGYIVNGPGGKLTLYTSPENNHAEGTIPNGETVYVSVTYTDAGGIVWGCAEQWDTSKMGWVPMDYLVAIYNSDDFRAEFSHRIEEESGSLPASEARVYFWSYPGSDSAVADMPLEGEYLPEYRAVFVDDAGRKWGYVGYYMGIKNTWICLDDPTADYDALYADHAPQQVTKPNITEPTEEIKPGGISPAVVIGAAAAVAAVSAALLVGLKKKK